MAVDYWIDEDGLGIEVYDEGGNTFICWSEIAEKIAPFLVSPSGQVTFQEIDDDQ